VSVNARGARGVTPLEFAIGNKHKGAAAELIQHKADPNLKDAEGNGAVTLAVNGYARDPELLRLVLDAGGDPNTRC
jgi:ankyrin repeat protein